MWHVWCACQMTVCVTDSACVRGVCVCVGLDVCSLLGAQTLPWCDVTYGVAHESELQEHTRTFLRESLPWALRANPERYPFLMPAVGTPQCQWVNGDGAMCGWSGAGPAAGMHPRCTKTVTTTGHTGSVSGNSSSSGSSSISGGGGGTSTSTSTSSGNRSAEAVVPRDAGLAGLSRLLNEAPLELLPAALTTEAEYTAFMSYLEPWIIGPPAVPLAVSQNPHPPVLQCSDKRCVCV